MPLVGPSLRRLVLVALALAQAGCAESLEEPAALAPVVIERVAVAQGLHEASIEFRVRNTSERTLAYRGYFGGVPVYRFAIRSAGRWVEATPPWLECGTGREDFTLEPGAEVTFEARSRRPDLPMRVGVGTWTPVEGEPPTWDAWSWVWSDAVVVDDLLEQELGGRRRRVADGEGAR